MHLSRLPDWFCSVQVVQKVPYFGSELRAKVHVQGIIKASDTVRDTCILTMAAFNRPSIDGQFSPRGDRMV